MIALKKIAVPFMVVALNACLAWMVVTNLSLGCMQLEIQEESSLSRSLIAPAVARPSYREACSGGEVVMTLTTTPQHLLLVPLVLESLNKQSTKISCLVVILNRFAEVPYYWTDRPGVTYHIPSSDSAQSGHFFDAEFLRRFTYHFGVADNIVYPENYVERMLQAVADGGRRVLSVECKRKTGAQTGFLFFRSPVLADVTAQQAYPGRDVDYVSHRTFAYATQKLVWTRSDLPPGLPGVETGSRIASVAQQSGMKMYCIQREWDWLQELSERAAHR
eukprot:TRINITY_DN112581_c0_g1_i1.p1 TRINITY_DN112581_c0_g1~~TRINITY_DN112581_c0_g1_i1.p1  ORF type:complete len:276 (+),score=13.29 TRINITY_DN112581_c0_g1_i1:136-963(+)